MKKTMSTIGSILILVFVLIFIIGNSNDVSMSIGLGFKIWKENLFPFLFPMFVISELLASYGFMDIISILLGNCTHKLFNVPKEAAYILIMSILSGFPSSAKNINSIYEKGKIDNESATKILLFTHFSNPLFIIGALATTLLTNSSLALIIFISHYTPNILIGLLFRKYHPIKKENDEYPLKNYFNKNIDNPNLGKVLGFAIINSVNTLLLILGTISIFLTLTTIINKVIDLGPLGNAILNGIFEMSQGLKYVSLLDISLQLKTVISTMIISFGGLSVHLQIMSILGNTKVKYLPFFIARVIHTIMSGIIAYILFPVLIT